MSYIFDTRKILHSIFVLYIIFIFMSACTSAKQTSSINDTSANEQRDQSIQNGMPDSEDSIPEETNIAPEILKQYVGTYKLTPDINLMVTLEGDRLMFQSPGQDKIPVYAMSETKFFFKKADDILEFFKDDTGTVSYLVVLQEGVENFASSTKKRLAPVEGTWTTTADGPDGKPLEMIYVFEAFGNMLRGTVSTRLGTGRFTGGKIDGNKISYSIRVDQSTIIETTGTVSGDVIHITHRNGDVEKQFTAKRVDK